MTTQSSSMTKNQKFVVAIVVLLSATWIYGYAKASNMLHERSLNIFTAAMTVNGLNPISAHGFKYYIKTETNMPETVRELQSSLDSLKSNY